MRYIKALLSVLAIQYFIFFPFVHSIQAEEGVLTVGTISDEPKQEAAIFQPFADYMASQLEDTGINKGQCIVSSSMVEAANLIKKGKVDIFIDSPFPTIRVHRLSGVKPFLRRWKEGVKEYNSIIFVRKDSNIDTIEDLNGKILVFEVPFSTSSYFLPKATLLKKGLTLTEKRNYVSSVSSHEIGYIFSGDDETTTVWVLRKRVAAGALNSKNFKQMAKDGFSNLKVLTETINLPRHVVSHRADLNPELVAAIEEVLLNMDKDEDGRKVLNNFEKTTKFDKFDSSVDGFTNAITNMIDLLGKDLHN